MADEDAPSRPGPVFFTCMQTPSLLDNVSIILADTKTPANIGAVARCMMNTGLSRLLLVAPRKAVDRESFKLAAGADEILEKSVVYPRLGDAVSGHGLVIGASRHSGKRRKNVITPRELAERVLPLLTNNKVAVVFGNEVSGLELPDIALCQELVAIPTAHAFPSLNLSHAVMVIAYELFRASLKPVPPSSLELAPTEDLEYFYTHLQRTLRTIGFLGDENAERMLLSLRQLFGRARLDSRDISILRGILNCIDRTGKC